MIEYRALTLNDHQGFYETALKSWLFTYKNIYSEEFIKNFIEENYSKKALGTALDWAQKNKGFNYVAVDEGQIVGYITVGLSDDSWKLFRIYILPEYIGKGIGSILLEMGEKFIISHGGTSYFLTVHKQNEIGKNFYTKKGFKHIPEKDEENEWYLIKDLLS